MPPLSQSISGKFQVSIKLLGQVVKNKGAAAPKEMQRPVAAMQPHRLPVGDYNSLPPIEFYPSIRPSFPQKALHTFKHFTKSQPFLPIPAPWDECLEKETYVDFFRDEAVTITSSRGFQTAHYLPKERQLQKGCNALALLRCNRIGCPSETTSLYRQ